MPLILISFIAIFLSLPKIYQSLIKPLHPISWEFTHPFEKKWQTQKMPPEIQAILSEPFSYLGRGLQFDCFESKDSNYVIKLFKNTKSAQKTFDTINSCKLTFDHLQKETGLIWVHLNPQKANVITLFDKLGRKFQLDPAIHRFILQKKFTPITPKLLKNIFATDPLRAQSLLLSYYHLLDSMSQKGILNSGSRFFDNFGIDQNQIVQIDIGKNIYNPRQAPLKADHFKQKIQQWVKTKI